MRDKARLVDAGEYQLEEESERLGFEDAAASSPRRRRIHGKSAPRVAVLERNPNLEPNDEDSPSDQEEIWALSHVREGEEVVSAPRVAVRHGNLVLEHYDDDLSSDQEESCHSCGIGDARDSREVQSPRVAVLGRNPDYEPDEDDSPGDQKEIRRQSLVKVSGSMSRWWSACLSCCRTREFPERLMIVESMVCHGRRGHQVCAVMEVCWVSETQPRTTLWPPRL